MPGCVSEISEVGLCLTKATLGEIMSSNQVSKLVIKATKEIVRRRLYGGKVPKWLHSRAICSSRIHD